MRKARTDATKNYYVAVGRKISEVRRRKAVTQEALASDISLTRTSVVNIELGKQQLLLHTLVKIARALKVQPVDLLPDISPDDDSIASVISDFVTDVKGQKWIETSIKSTSKRT